MPYKNKEDQAAYLKKWREQNREKTNAYGQYGQAERRQRNRQIVEAAKDVPCADCGIRYPSYVMDFDHVSGEKIKEVSKLANNCMSVEILQAEIDKCEVVCANCHRIRTFNR